MEWSNYRYSSLGYLPSFVCIKTNIRRFDSTNQLPLPGYINHSSSYFVIIVVSLLKKKLFKWKNLFSKKNFISVFSKQSSLSDVHLYRGKHEVP